MSNSSQQAQTPGGEKPRRSSRFLSYVHGTKADATITLQGSWINSFGFKPGCRLEVEVVNGLITIKPTEKNGI